MKRIDRVPNPPQVKRQVSITSSEKSIVSSSSSPSNSHQFGLLSSFGTICVSGSERRNSAAFRNFTLCNRSTRKISNCVRQTKYKPMQIATSAANIKPHIISSSDPPSLSPIAHAARRRSYPLLPGSSALGHGSRLYRLLRHFLQECAGQSVVVQSLHQLLSKSQLSS